MGQKDQAKQTNIAALVAKEAIKGIGRVSADLVVVALPIRTAYIQFTPDGLWKQRPGSLQYSLKEKLKINAMVAGTDAMQAGLYVSWYFQYLA